jgi:CHAT domain-containing protein
LLLERNLIAFSPSLSVLYHCISRRSRNTFSLQKSTVFGNPSEDREAAEASAIAIAQRLGVKPYIGSQASKPQFEESAPNASIFFYQGHAAYNTQDPLSSALILSKASANVQKELTAGEIFKMRLRTALFIMIACESAQQDIHPGEEPTGLLPMLMLAGVNSMIGTLWRCRDSIGKMFAQEFFEELLSEFDSGIKGHGLMVNTARAV